MGATSAASSKSTSIEVAAIAATLSICTIGLALALYCWREAVEKRKLKAAAESGTPVWEQNGFVFANAKLKDPAHFDLEEGSESSSSSRRHAQEHAIPLVDLRPPVPALIRTPATGDV